MATHDWGASPRSGMLHRRRGSFKSSQLRASASSRERCPCSSLEVLRHAASSFVSFAECDCLLDTTPSLASRHVKIASVLTLVRRGVGERNTAGSSRALWQTTEDSRSRRASPEPSIQIPNVKPSPNNMQRSLVQLEILREPRWLSDELATQPCYVSERTCDTAMLRF